MKKKRFWGILLSLVMLLGLMPETSMTAQAEDAEPQLTYQVSLYKNDKGWKVYRTHQTTTSFTINGGDFMIAVGHTSGTWWIYRNKGSNTGIMSLTGSADWWNQRNNVKVRLNGIGTGSASIQEAYAPNGNKNKRVNGSTRTIQAKIERECAASATDYTCEYDQNPHTIGGVNVVFPQSGAVIKYGTVNNAYTLTEAPTFTNAGTYTVYYQVSGTADDLGAWVPVTGSATVTINKAPAPTVTVPTLDAVTYDPEKTLADIDLPEGWAWTDETAVPTVDNTGYNAALTVDDANYDYTGVEGYDADTHRVIRTVALTVNNPQIAPAYTVTIPATVDLGGAPATVSIDSMENIPTGKSVRVTIEGDTDGNFTVEQADDKLSYTITGTRPSHLNAEPDDTTQLDVKDSDEILHVDGADDTGNPRYIELKFNEPEQEPKYAGDYTGTVTFNVSLS
ncbi:hypothetical protein RASY3_03095 [Ruminococcus albus SY3]|uniref:Uncharacterized protein n=2 Tax=Ruminococcus albus TaxID=1264 RepID=A0A011W0G1_RUMAL|nr:hypothetical protein [Ruminococcus albus]EXM38687.1 hypothetical protein RASY3_18360 [Ruminococcus albus SY3]EXM41041.1 hypothetical protein RASY3_03095 [Ruminococcus albus SY3]SEL43345.1 hypothetical protein SAMN05216469_1305 [Ruminococcus albus]